MPRTVNEAVYRVRREAFLDAAQQLITSKGYEEMSIRDLLGALDTSRGAFYHYFDSKQELLEGVVERFADAAMVRLQPVLDDPALPALTKLERFLGGIAGYKAEQLDLVLAIIKVWTSDANALVREKVRKVSVSRLGPVLSRVIREGAEQGTVHVTYPEETAAVLAELMLGFQELATGWYLGRRDESLTFEEVVRAYRAGTEAFERVLGIPPGAVRWLDEATLGFWFG